MNEEQEEAQVLSLLGTGSTEFLFSDDLHRRLSSAFAGRAASDVDKGVLVRQLLRRWSLRDGRDVPIEVDGVISHALRRVSDRVGLRERSDGMWIADSWRPDWLALDGVPDIAALAGTSDGERFHSAPLSADPFFVSSTGFDTYRTPGQRAACRAVMSAPEASTLIAMLPTGSGKTEIALCLADKSKRGLTAIVVPTVALAYDFERRFREHFVRRNPKLNPAKLPIAWTAGTSDAVRDELKLAISNGQQPLLVTSPESMTRALRQTLLDAASIGRLKGFVIDEAHLVTQWGRSFRPEFRTLADFRRELLNAAETSGHPRPVTLLLSATLGEAEISDLVTYFGKPGPCSPIVANALRSEPEIWVAHALDTTERDARVRDTIDHCARPAILYVTSPTKAEEWLNDLRGSGYSRIAMVTGNSTATERAEVLEGIRASSDEGASIDLVVATSAFGLGIDYQHIRTVVHSCLPETVDRWYQEMGRGGRDGDVCGAFLVTAAGDEKEAASLGVTVLTPEVAEKRWRDLWGHRTTVNERIFIDLEGSRGVGRGDYNRRWNAQLIQGLVELGELKRDQFVVDDLRELLRDDAVEMSDWTSIIRHGAGLGMDIFWNDVWAPWQQEETKRSRNSLNRMRAVSCMDLGACTGIAEAYAPTSELLDQWGTRLEHMEPVGRCGRCPDCRRLRIPMNEDPAPDPAQVWAVAAQEDLDLEAFVTAARGENGLAILTYRQENERLVLRIAEGLVRLGVRHLGGLINACPKAPPGEVLFTDTLPLTPNSVTPLSTLSYFSPKQQVSRFWNARRQRARLNLAGFAVFDVLLVPAGVNVGLKEVGRDIPAMPFETAAELLQGSWS
ncbi:protein DpdF [Mycolicibacterium arenosum]|uniref:DNA 3'-5' helicase n=1 Tax=Mycolicibacterium arenosum TaxID=2952157 RepID=A0ABT1M4G6_9MYCO|nr:protein DpdF [Mycolicibacterium sp. CAU 1645]MCP9274061.1 DEAD/DEAH box helicase [Mycolicibacterium sp. CAU 1645]